MPGYKPPTRTDFFHDLTFDGRLVGTMLKEDWDALVVYVDATWTTNAIREFVVAQQFKTDVHPNVIVVNVQRYIRESA